MPSSILNTEPAWSWLAALLFLGMPGLAAFASEADEPQEAIEVRGLLRHGIFAIGGETTGTEITDGDRRFELDLSADPAFGTLAEQLNGQQVVVTGTLEIRPGVEIAERRIIHVATLAAATQQ